MVQPNKKGSDMLQPNQEGDNMLHPNKEGANMLHTNTVWGLYAAIKPGRRRYNSSNSKYNSSPQWTRLRCTIFSDGASFYTHTPSGAQSAHVIFSCINTTKQFITPSSSRSNLCDVTSNASIQGLLYGSPRARITTNWVFFNSYWSYLAIAAIFHALSPDLALNNVARNLWLAIR